MKLNEIVKMVNERRRAIDPSGVLWPLDYETEISKVYDSSDFSDVQLSDSFKGCWEFTGSNSVTTKLEDWTSNLSTWWSDLFETNKWDISKVIEGKKELGETKKLFPILKSVLRKPLQK